MLATRSSSAIGGIFEKTGSQAMETFRLNAQRRAVSTQALTGAHTWAAACRVTANMILCAMATMMCFHGP
jgi:hypothetical protein